MARRQQALCRDFQKGNCRFGASCKFLHDLGQAAGGRSQKDVFGGNSFGALASGGRSQAPPANTSEKAEHKCENPRVCQDQIREDFQTEKPKEWTLSAYAHWKYLPNDVSGDISFEELRWDSYVAARQGDPLQQVAAREKQLMQSKEVQYQQLLLNPKQNPAQTALLFGKPVASNKAPLTSPFGQSPVTQPTSIFGKPVSSGSQAVSSPFGQSGFGPSANLGTTPQGFWSQSSSPFGQPQSQTPVSGANPQANQTPPSNVFGATSTSPFGASSQASPPNTIFGVTPTSSPFGGSNQNVASPFGSQLQTQQPAFGSGTVFGKQATSSNSPFGPQSSSQAQPIFGRAQTAAAPSPFGSQQGVMFGVQAAPPFGSTATSPFGTAQSQFGQANGAGNGVPALQSEAVSTAASIDPGEDPNRDVWMAAKFELGKIPEQEPPLYAR